MSHSTVEPSPVPPSGSAQPRRRMWLGVAGLLALAALAICLYLAWAAIAGGNVAGCGSGGDCERILTSRWARWFGLPVAAPAAVIYAAILAALGALALSRDEGARRRIWCVLVPLATLVLVAAAWFAALQFLVIGKFCGYCLAVHGCGVVLALLVLFNVPHDWRLPNERAAEPAGLPPATTLLLALCGFLAAGMLVAGQWLGTAAAPEMEITTIDGSTSTPPGKDPTGSNADKSAEAEKLPIDISEYFPAVENDPAGEKVRPRRISLIGGQAILDVRRTPRLGNPDAPVVVVELFDYTCPHCRRLHGFLTAARERYGDQLAVVPLVTPMDPACNRHVKEPAIEPGSCELARLAVAVWQTRPEAFAEFHDWLLASPETRPVAAAHERAAELLAEVFFDRAGEVLDRAVADPQVTREIEADNHLYQAAGAGTIPKLLSERQIITGEPASAEKLFEVMERQFGLEPSAK